MKRLLLLLAFLACGDAAAFKPGALGGHSGLGRHCGALGNCGGATYGFPNVPFNFVIDGNSIAAGSGAALPAQSWSNQFSTALTSIGASYTLTNVAHGGNTTANLTALIASEVDPLWVAGKNNVLIFQEVLNDMCTGCGGGGCSGAAAYANVVTFMRTLAKPWYAVLITPGPQGVCAVPAYEAARSAFLALVSEDPTFSGTVKLVYRLDADPRLGTDAAKNDAHYFLDTTHPTAGGHGIIMAALFDRLRTVDRNHFPYDWKQQPYSAAAYSANVTGSALTTSGGVATDGQAVAAWTTTSVEGGSAVQATGSLQPTYSATGFGGHPALTWPDNTTALLTSTSVRTGYTTNVFTYRATSGGHLALTFAPNYRYNILDNIADIAIYETDTVLSAGHSVPIGTFVGDIPHLVVFQTDGTLTHQKIWVDGSPITLGALAYNNDAPSTQSSQIWYMGNTAGAFVGKLGEYSISPVVYSATELSNLTTCLCSLRHLTCANTDPTLALGAGCLP